MEVSNVLNALIAIQQGLKAPKDQSAGRYRYRNIEDVNEAIKPLASENGCAVVYTDEFTDDGRCISTCKLIADDGEISATGVSYVNRTPKNMSIEQASGSASSYARKYAACGLFAIDSSKDDPDRANAKPKTDLEAAKQRMWGALKRFAEHSGLDPMELLKETQASPDWAETVDFLDSVTRYYQSQLEWSDNG